MGLPDPETTPLHELLGIIDGIDSGPFPTSWDAPAATALRRLDHRLTHIDRAVLVHLDRTLRTLGPWLDLTGDGSDEGDGSHEDHPIAVALLHFERQRSPPPTALWILLGILLEAALRCDIAERKEINALAQFVRGAPDRIEIRRLLGDARSVPEIKLRVESHRAQGKREHKGFEDLWNRWLGDRLDSWLLADPAALRQAMRPLTLVSDIEAPEILVQSQATAEPDDTTCVAVEFTDALESGETPPPARIARSKARAAALLRGSQGDLLGPEAQQVPEAIIIRLATAALREAKSHQAIGERPASEPFAAFALALATGIRESDLAALTWGDTPSLEHRESLAIDRPILWRRILPPPNAFQSTPALADYLEPVADAIPWPIPQALYTLLLGLGPTLPVAGRPVLPRLSLEVACPYRLADTIKRLMPEAGIGASPLRRVLAMHLARNLGTEAAQLALSDSFSVSLAPTYYAGARVEDLWRTLSPRLAAWFASPVPVNPPLADRSFGSRLVLTDTAAASWSDALLHARRSLPHRKDASELEAWARHRDFLAAALCAATGHRPVNALGDIDLDHVIPEYGLILLRDKQVDPLRKVRVAATGSRWTTELRAFLDRLIDIADSGGEGATLAAVILRSEAPLFSVPGPDGPLPFTAAALRATMPLPLQEADNWYRHRLNHQLQHAGIDPELRHFQLGWVVSPAHATADFAPVAPRDLAAELGPAIDAYLLKEGWFGRRQQLSPWTWEGVPLRAWRDWAAVEREHLQDHRTTLARLRLELKERGRAVREAILPRLAHAVHEFLPGLRLDTTRRRLVGPADGREIKVLEMTEDLCGLLADRVRQGDQHPAEALEAMITRIELVRLLKQSHRDGLTSGFIPRRPILSHTADPSPFIAGLGLAVRQVEQMRTRLLAQAKANHRDDLGDLATLGILLHSPYRNLAWARAAVSAAAKAVRAARPGDTLRVPAVLGTVAKPMAFSGLPALWLVRRGMETPGAHVPTEAHLATWVKRHLSPDDPSAEGKDLLEAVAATARAAGRLELSGPERLIMLEEVSLNGVSVERCLALEDDWPVRTLKDPATVLRDRPQALYESEGSATTSPATPKPEPGPSARGAPLSAAVPHRSLTDLFGLLNPDRFHRTLGLASDSRHGQKARLRTELLAFRDAVGARTNMGLLAGFALHLIVRGGPRRRGLEPRTIYDLVERFAKRLLDAAGRSAVLELTGAEIETTYATVLAATPRLTRAETREALQRFHGFLEETYQCDPLAWAALKSFAGPRLPSVDPGLFTDAEVEAVYEALVADVEGERTLADAAPDFQRLTELRLLLFVLLEASGIRPGSARGLLYGDLHLHGEGHDYLHLHRSGGFGSAKTDTSLGFVPLEGSLWTRARPWVLAWLAEEQTRLAPDSGWKTPLFAETRGEKRRFAKGILQGRHGELLRWASAEPKAKNYWLRKRRVTARHQAITELAPCRARDVHTALCHSGHAGIQTPLTSYIADVAVPLAHSLREGCSAPRASVLAVTALVAQPLDLAWIRAGKSHRSGRMGVVYARLKHAPARRPTRRYASPPPLRRLYDFLPRHIDAFARARHAGDGFEEAMLRVELSPRQGEALERAAEDLAVMRGDAPWPLPQLRYPRSLMHPARWLEGSEGLRAALDRSPSETLYQLADRWAATGHSDRLLVDPAGVVLPRTWSTADAIALLNQHGVDSDLIDLSMEGSFTTLRLRRPSGEFAKSGDVLTLMSALDWLLAMAWLHRRALSGAPQPP
ncbi:MAG: hypothetical protein KGO02_11600 [Alphaproteobacteria bacterium]|nr:hypothetical protein [Alphaproteobacteria bacterium]